MPQGEYGSMYLHAGLDTGTSALNLSAVGFHPDVEEHMKGKKGSSTDRYQNFPNVRDCPNLCKLQPIHRFYQMVALSYGFEYLCRSSLGAVSMYVSHRSLPRS